MSLRKKPWNRVNLPVYSISSTDGRGNHNMHIITYVTAISMQPKLFICGIYQGTKTLSHVQQHPRFVLQLLHAGQHALVNILGKKSGNTYDKMQYLRKRNLVREWNGWYILKDALAVMELEATPCTLPAGAAPDHVPYLCSLLAYRNLNEGEALTLDDLRSRKIIRI